MLIYIVSTTINKKKCVSHENAIFVGRENVSLILITKKIPETFENAQLLYFLITMDIVIWMSLYVYVFGFKPLYESVIPNFLDRSRCVQRNENNMKDCAKFCRSLAIVGLVDCVPSCHYDIVGIFWVQFFFSRGYFECLFLFSSWLISWLKVFQLPAT